MNAYNDSLSALPLFGKVTTYNKDKARGFISSGNTKRIFFHYEGDCKYDENYNYGSLIAKGAGNTIKQEQWLKQNWKKISDTDPTDRQPGDVAINDTRNRGPRTSPSRLETC